MDTSERHIAAPEYHTHPAQRAKISMIATPLGNLDDLTPRARNALLNADELWCEDTRRTQALLSALMNAQTAAQSSQTPKRMPKLKRLDQHTEEKEIRKWLEVVESSGQWIGIVTDAGTPGISDPGGLVTAVATHYPQIRIEPLPGASAVAALVSIAGFEENSFLFRGFFPRAEKDATELLNELKNSGVTRNWIFFESPNRILDTIQILQNWSKLQPFQAEFVFAKELTKLHESVYRGYGPDFFESLESAIRTGALLDKGEWCLAVIIPKSYVKTEKTESDWVLTMECLISAGIGPKEATSAVLQRFSVAKNLAYRTAIEIQKKIKI